MNAPHHPQVNEAAILAAFSDAIRAAGLTPPERITADGAIHRFSSSGKRGDDAGRYRLHLDGVPAGWFQCWRTMDHAENWSAKSASEMTDALGPMLLEEVKKRVPAKRLGEAWEIAEAVLFLVAPSSGYLTAQVVTVDGGLIG